MKPARLTTHGILFGIGMTYVALLILLPIAVLAIRTAQLAPTDIWQILTASDTLAAFKVSFGQAFLASIFNTVTGVPVAYVLARYRFPGRKFLELWIDLPFALPTAVAGIAICGLYSESGWLGSLLAPLGIKIAYTTKGIFVALVFVGLPFVIRTVQPIVENLDLAEEEAAACLGASRFYTFRRVILPALMPAIVTGFSMAFARGLGEYGSVIFIAGNIPGESEILPLRIVHALESYDYATATILATTMLTISFAILIAINLLQRKHALKH